MLDETTIESSLAAAIAAAAGLPEWTSANCLALDQLDGEDELKAIDRALALAKNLLAIVYAGSSVVEDEELDPPVEVLDLYVELYAPKRKRDTSDMGGKSFETVVADLKNFLHHATLSDTNLWKFDRFHLLRTEPLSDDKYLVRRLHLTARTKRSSALS